MNPFPVDSCDLVIRDRCDLDIRDSCELDY